MLAELRRSPDRSLSCPFSGGHAPPSDAPGFFCAPDGAGGVIVPPHRERRRAEAERAHGWLLERVEPDRHPCVAARSAFNSESYRFGLYPALASADATAGLAADLERFARGVGEADGTAAADASDFATFVAIFDAPLPAVADEAAEITFERELWTQLQALHEADAHGWDPATSPDPTHKDFSFSFAGRSFYIIGMHPDASRPARRFPRPALVFNLHAQFERLRETGSYEKMRDLIRERDTEQTGGMNPMLADFGKRSEAVQYSGRAVAGAWQCPFHPENAQ